MKLRSLSDAEHARYRARHTLAEDLNRDHGGDADDQPEIVRIERVRLPNRPPNASAKNGPICAAITSAAPRSGRACPRADRRIRAEHDADEGREADRDRDDQQPRNRRRSEQVETIARTRAARRDAEHHPDPPPISERISASIRNCVVMSRLLPPIALRMPISRVRSVTETSMMFMMPMPATSSATPPIAVNPKRRRSSSRTRRRTRCVLHVGIRRAGRASGAASRRRVAQLGSVTPGCAYTEVVDRARAISWNVEYGISM
jgi:hypothetical protein